MKYFFYCIAVIALLTVSCNNNLKKKQENADMEDVVKTPVKENVNLPAPYDTKSVMVFSDVIGWPQGKIPLAPDGFTVSKLADGLLNPRWIYEGPNGDLFVAESATEPGIIGKIKSVVSGQAKSGASKSANRITIIRDANHDGVPELKQVFLSGLHQPFGMLILNNQFYVGNTDGVMVFPYKTGQTQITEPGKMIVALPAGGYNNHWTRNIITNRDHSKIYVAVGSSSNVAEHGMEYEKRRACILQMNPNGTGEKIYASGLRNPQGMAWATGTNTLWTAVNERDLLGDDLVPDYLTSVKKDGFYGWPYSYWGQHEDPRMKDKQNPALVQKAIVPDVSMGAHTASLGLAFDENNKFPGRYAGGAFIGQHGSWNRSTLSGYQVAFVPFTKGKPTGKMEPFLTGFIADSAKQKVYGRPVGVCITRQNMMLVADDVSNTIWMVKPK